MVIVLLFYILQEIILSKAAHFLKNSLQYKIMFTQNFYKH